MPDILLVTVTKVETEAVLEILPKASGTPWKRQHVGDKTYYNLGQIDSVEIFLVQSEMGAVGPGAALITVYKAIEALQCTAVIMVGIAFGMKPGEQKLGDILVAKQIQSYEQQKIENRGKVIPRGDRVTCSPALLDKFRSGVYDWPAPRIRSGIQPSVHFGLVLSGEKLINNQAFCERLRKQEPEAIGGEMEGAGLYTAASDSKVDWILVKAICDFADGNKNDSAQPMAAKNAAAFALHVIQRGGWELQSQDRSNLHNIQNNTRLTSRQLFHRGYLISGMVLTAAVYLITLWMFPEWAQSWKLLITLGVAVVAGVAAFLANLRQALEPDSEPVYPAETIHPQIQPVHSGPPQIMPRTVILGRTPQIATGEGGRNIQAQGHYIENVDSLLIQSSRPVEPHHLPPPPSRAVSFVDRGPIVNELLDTLRQHGQAAVVGVGGMGGVGKTELARYLYARLKEESRLVAFFILADRMPVAVLTQMAHLLGVDISDCQDDIDRAARLREALANQPYIIFLDDARANFPLELCLPPSPPCAVLVTSRIRNWPLPMLNLDIMTVEQSIELIRSEMKDQVKALDHEPEAALKLIALCAYHPLALNLAARRLLKRLNDSDTPVSDFNDNISNRLKGLEIRPGPLDSLRVNFNLSYDALSPQSQQRFRQLAVFALSSGFILESARVMWGLAENDEQAVEARLEIERLQEASLLIPLPGAPGRFGLHDLLREYALEKLQEMQEIDQVYRVLANFIVGLFAQIYFPNPEVMHFAVPELDNLRIAAEWALKNQDGILLAQLATTPRNWFYNVFRAWDEWLIW